MTDDDDDDLMRSILGSDDDDGDDNDPAWLLHKISDGRAANSVELDLREHLHFAQMAARGDLDEIPFLESDDPAEVERVDAHQAIVERLHAPAAATWGPLIEIARSLGPTGTKEEYEAAARAQGLEPWPKS